MVVAMNGLDGFAARRQLIDHAHVEVAIERHSQRARNGRGGHHEHVRGHLRLGLHPRPLCHAEAVLLIDHHQAQLREHHAVLQQGMRAHEDVDFAQLQCCEQALARGGFGASCEEAHHHGQTLQKA